jgi:hypothetical protein
MNPIHIPQDWDDCGLITFEEFCGLIHAPQRGGPRLAQTRRRARWARFEGCGRLYIQVAEARRFVGSATSKATARVER